LAEKKIKSVGNAIRVLILLADHPEGLRLSQIADGTELVLSTAHLLLSTLADYDFVEAVGGGVYRLGLGAFRVGTAIGEVVSIGEPLRPAMERLATDCHEAVSLAVRHGAEAVITQRYESSKVLRADIRVGTPMPLHGSASGKCFLAEMNDDDVRALVETQTTRRGTGCAVNVGQLLVELKAVRDNGFATNYDEFVEDISACAAPVRYRSGAVVAALSVAGPSGRFRPAEWSDIVRTVAAGMSRLLGAGTDEM
jgi:DNA-binding IclR family transcriptional regulator